MPELRRRRVGGKESEAEQEKSRHGYYPSRHAGYYPRADDDDDDPDWMNGPESHEFSGFTSDEDRAWEAELEAREWEAAAADGLIAWEEELRQQGSLVKRQRV